jgi:hypothetical protein
MKGNRTKVYPVPAGDSFEQGGETFTVVGPISEPQFIELGNRWPKANRRPRGRPDANFTFSSDENYIWAIVDEFGYFVAKAGAAVLDDVIGDAGAFTVGGMSKHPEMYGEDANYQGRGFNTKLDEYRMPFIRNLAEERKIPIVFDLSNDSENRLAKYQSLGFETLSANDEKHPYVPERHYNTLKAKGRTYAIYVPESMKEDKAMKKAWEILKIMPQVRPPMRRQKQKTHDPSPQEMQRQFTISRNKGETCDYCHRPYVLDCPLCRQKLCMKHLSMPCSTGEGDYRYG